jgi:glycosyltransferase involved in cell wall biosynthesis
VALLTGGQDKPYAVGMALALVKQGVFLEIIGSDEVASPDLLTSRNVAFLNLRGDQSRTAPLSVKVLRVLKYYARLIRYAATAKPTIFHILWNNKIESFDRTLLVLYYKLLGKKVFLTAHNINSGRRDSKDSLLNRVTLTMQYRLVDHIFVHTEKMKMELIEGFGARAEAVTVFSYPLNSVIPDTSLSPAEAKQRLRISAEDRTILFFGRICPYKGVEYLIAAFQQLVGKDPRYRLMIAGEPGKDGEAYWEELQQMIGKQPDRITLNAYFIADHDAETYLKGADVLVLPYRDISQSGILFLAYGFGLPVIATDVGSFRQSIVDGKTGFLCRAEDPLDLALTIEKYFESDLFRTQHSCRRYIVDYARAHHSADSAAALTVQAYASATRQ